MNEVTQILNAIERGDRQAAGQLLPLIYDELWKLAAQKLAHESSGQTLQATALVHEAYVRLVGGGDAERWDNRGHFFAAAAESMRRILIENARRKLRLKHGGEFERVEFQRLVDDTKHQPSAESIGNARFTWKNFLPESDPEHHPVCGVSWDDAAAFCRWLSDKTKQGYSLPTEAQWEYACRAGSQTLWSFGDDESALRQYANTAPADAPLPPAVGKKLANPFGLFDMHGNVDEWCLDWHMRDFYDRSPLVAPVFLNKPGDPASGRVARGGAWNAAPWWSRSTTRAYDFPTSPTHPKGFRVVVNFDGPQELVE